MSATAINPVSAPRTGSWSWSRNFRHRSWTVVRVAVGLMLIAAAAGKLIGIRVSSLGEVGWFSQPLVQIAVSAWEISLAILLLSGRMPHQARSATILTFVVFASISLGWAINGVSDCGCLGSIPAHPWTIFLVDFLIVVALLVARPNGESFSLNLRSRPSYDSHLLHIALVACVLLSAVGAFGIIRYGSLSAAFQRLQGHDVTLNEAYTDFGTAPPGATIVRNVTVRNWSDATIRVVGFPRNCSLSTRTALPLDIPAHESRNVEVGMIVPRASEGTLTIRTGFWTDSAKVPYLPYWVDCRVGSSSTRP